MQPCYLNHRPRDASAFLLANMQKLNSLKMGLKYCLKKIELKTPMHSNNANIKVSSFEKIFLNKLFNSSSTFYI